MESTDETVDGVGEGVDLGGRDHGSGGGTGQLPPPADPFRKPLRSGGGGGGGSEYSGPWKFGAYRKVSATKTHWL